MSFKKREREITKGKKKIYFCELSKLAAKRPLKKEGGKNSWNQKERKLFKIIRDGNYRCK